MHIGVKHAPVDALASFPPLLPSAGTGKHPSNTFLPSFLPPPPPLQELVNLLLVMSQADGVVKGFVCTKDNLQQLLECLGRVQPPHLVKVRGGGERDAAKPVGVSGRQGVFILRFGLSGALAGLKAQPSTMLLAPPFPPPQLMKAVRWLSSDHAVVPAIKEAGAIPCLVPFLAAERAGAAALGSEVQLEALHALYNICNLNKRVRGGGGRRLTAVRSSVRRFVSRHFDGVCAPSLPTFL